MDVSSFLPDLRGDLQKYFTIIQQKALGEGDDTGELRIHKFEADTTCYVVIHVLVYCLGRNKESSVFIFTFIPEMSRARRRSRRS